MRDRFERCIRKVKTSKGIEDRRRIVHVLFNPYSTYSNFLNRLDLSSDLAREEIDNVKANLVLNVFEELEGGLANDLNDTPLEILSKFYWEVSKVMKEAENLYV